MSPQWGGGRLFGASAVFFYENGRNLADFQPVFRFSAKCKNGRFSVIRARTRSIVNVGLFLVGRTVLSSFIDHGPKLRVLLLAIGEWPEIAKIQDKPRKMTPTSETEFFWVALGVLVICLFDEKS